MAELVTVLLDDRDRAELEAQLDLSEDDQQAQVEEDTLHSKVCYFFFKLSGANMLR